MIQWGQFLLVGFDMYVDAGKLILDDEEWTEIQNRAYELFSNYQRNLGGVRGQTLTRWDSVDAFFPQATYEFFQKLGHMK